MIIFMLKRAVIVTASSSVRPCVRPGCPLVDSRWSQVAVLGVELPIRRRPLFLPRTGLVDSFALALRGSHAGAARPYPNLVVTASIVGLNPI